MNPSPTSSFILNVIVFVSTAPKSTLDISAFSLIYVWSISIGVEKPPYTLSSDDDP